MSTTSRRVDAGGRMSAFSYLDGISVKIGEKFRAPRKVTLPLCYQQRCLSDAIEQEYDFCLENQVLELSETRRKGKEAAERIRAGRLASSVDEFARCNLEDVPGDMVHGPRAATLEPNAMLTPVVTSEPSSTLKPDVVTLVSSSKLLQDIENFESESSPFDSEALKTLNDLEELRTVLQNVSLASGTQAEPAGDGDTTLKSAEVSTEVSEEPVVLSPNDKITLRTTRSTPDLLKELGANGATQKVVGGPRPSSAGPEPEVEDRIQRLVGHIADMGFPSALVARAVYKFGVEDKKQTRKVEEVVEHLCLLQSLVESGYDAAQAEAALFLNGHDVVQAEKYLQLTSQFRGLGFDDESVKNALLHCGNDRDKVLDYLVS